MGQEILERGILVEGEKVGGKRKGRARAYVMNGPDQWDERLVRRMQERCARKKRGWPWKALFRETSLRPAYLDRTEWKGGWNDREGNKNFFSLDPLKVKKKKAILFNMSSQYLGGLSLSNAEKGEENLRTSACKGEETCLGWRGRAHSQKEARVKE